MINVLLRKLEILTLSFFAFLKIVLKLTGIGPSEAVISLVLGQFSSFLPIIK